MSKAASNMTRHCAGICGAVVMTLGFDVFLIVFVLVCLQSERAIVEFNQRLAKHGDQNESTEQLGTYGVFVLR